MKHATLALIVSAAFASPLALAASETPTQTAPAANSPAATTPATEAGPTTNPTTAPNATTTPKADAAPGTAASPTNAMTDEDRKRLNDALGTGTTGPDRTGAEMRAMSVKDLKGKDVHNGEGEKIGEVSDVVSNNTGAHYIVIGKGGFFGIGEDRAALPAERFWVNDDHLVVQGVTKEDIESMADARTGKDEPYNDLDNDVMVDVAVWKKAGG